MKDYDIRRSEFVGPVVGEELKYCWYFSCLFSFVIHYDLYMV